MRFHFRITVWDQWEPHKYSRLITVCFKNHFLTSLAGRSANIAALPFLLVSVHTSLTKTTSLPDMERGESDHPWLGHVQTPLYNPSWPPSLPLMEHVGPLSLPVHSLLFQQCHSEPFEGGTARDEWEPERQRARLDHFFTSSQMFTTQHNSCTLNTLTYIVKAVLSAIFLTQWIYERNVCLVLY